MNQIAVALLILLSEAGWLSSPPVKIDIISHERMLFQSPLTLIQLLCSLQLLCHIIHMKLVLIQLNSIVLILSTLQRMYYIIHK